MFGKLIETTVNKLINKMVDTSNSVPILLKDVKSWNIVKYQGIFYGIPHMLGPIELDLEDDRNHPAIVSAKTLQEVERLIAQTGEDVFPKFIQRRGEYDIVKCIAYYAIPHFLGKVDLMDKQQRSHPEILTAKSLNEIENLIDTIDKPILIEERNNVKIVQFMGQYIGVPLFLESDNIFNIRNFEHPAILKADTLKDLQQQIDDFDPIFWQDVLQQPSIILLKNIEHFDLVRYQGLFYGIPKAVGPVDMEAEEKRDHPTIFSAARQQEVERLITQIDDIPPKFIINRGEYNIVKSLGYYYAIPHFIGKVDLMNKDQRNHPAILIAKSLEELERLVDNIVSDYYRPILLEERNNVKIVQFMEKYIGIPLSLGDINIFAIQSLKYPAILESDSLEELQQQIDEFDPMFWQPVFLDMHRSYQLIRFMGKVYAMPDNLKLPDVFDLLSGDWFYFQRGILCVSTSEEAIEKIDKHLMPTEIVYAGWLPIVRRFGECGTHPQFNHLNVPPLGYKFTSLKKELKSTSTLWLLLKGIRRFGISWIKLAINSFRRGGTASEFLTFIYSRGLMSQLLLPRKPNLVFLPSVPYTYSQGPWVIEIEDVTTLFFPFIHNGETKDIVPSEIPCFSMVKVLLESPMCRGIITHVKSSAECLPHLFKNEELTRKITYIPLGIPLPIHLTKQRSQEQINLLFTNSWHQDPKSFYVRGGLDVLETFYLLRQRFFRIHLTIRSSLPSDLPERYRKIIKECDNIQVEAEFLPALEFEKLMCSADIYLLPSARIHVVSLLQAMGYGMTVVTSDGWGIEEYIRDGRNGCIVRGRYGKCSWVEKGTGMLREDYTPLFKADPTYVQKLYETLAILINDKELRQSLGRQAREDVHQYYNLDNWNQGLKRALDKALLYC